jgi:hypothetical protein
MGGFVGLTHGWVRGSAGDYCIGVQKAVQVILRRTLFRNRLEVSLSSASLFLLPASLVFRNRLEVSLLSAPLYPSVRSSLPALRPSDARAPPPLPLALLPPSIVALSPSCV